MGKGSYFFRSNAELVKIIFCGIPRSVPHINRNDISCPEIRKQDNY